MVSVIVIGRNEGARLEACFKSIEKACQFLSHEIIYVDSASTDNSLELAKKYARCYVVKDPMPTPGLGRYIGTETANGDWLLFLDGDMQLEENFVMNALSRAAALQADAITGLRHDLYYRGNTLLSENPNYFGCTAERPTPEFGGALMISRNALRDAGGWSPDTVACEEEELHSRLLAKKKVVMEIPEPMIKHTDCVTENRSPVSILLNRRQLGQGEAFRCACAHGTADAYLRFHPVLFLFYLLDWIAILSLVSIHPWGLPVFCLLEAFQLGFYLSRKLPRRFASQKLFFVYFPAGLLTYHVRSREYIAHSEGVAQ